MRITAIGHKLHRVALLGLAVTGLALAIDASSARADDEWHGGHGWRGEHGEHDWDRHGWRHHADRFVVVERPAPYYYYAPAPVFVAPPPPAYAYPAPVYAPPGDSFFFSLNLR